MATKSSRRGRLTNFNMAYHFTEEEKLQLGQDLVQALADTEQKEADFKQIQKECKREIDACKFRAFTIRLKVKTGEELRPVAARLIINMTEGLREYYAVDTDELLGTEPMQDGDEQLTINDLD